MKNIVGPPVYGNNFKYRERNLKKALRYLINDNSFLILGIRRTGKSSFLRQTAFRLPELEENCIRIELNCQTYTNILDFYKGLYDEMPKDMKTKFTKFIGESKQIPTKLLDYITDIFDSVEAFSVKVDFHDKILNYSKPLEDLVTKFFKETEHVFLFIDELPFFFENIGKSTKNIAEITQILSNLRSWRNAGVAMGITGSLNLHQQLEHLGISRKLLAGLNTIVLAPFTREQSEAFIQELLVSDEKEWNQEVIQKLLDLIPDYVPYFLQYAYNEVAVAQCATADEVEEVYHNDIMTGLFSDFIYQFDERLGVFDKGDLKLAMLILDVIVMNPNVKLNTLQTQAGEDFNYDVIVKLINYEFIKLSGMQEYDFTLQIIKNWWITKRNLS